MVKSAIEKQNKERLVQLCYKDENGKKTPKTKTISIIGKLENEKYNRGPEKEILGMTKYNLETVMIARYGMLESGTNYKGSFKLYCDTCRTIDDENHRLNSCTKWTGKNLAESNNNVDCNDIRSPNLQTIQNLLPYIEQLWNTKNAHGTIREKDKCVFLSL